MTPILTSAVSNIPKAGAIPISVFMQYTINDKNERIEKKQMAHDLSLTRSAKGNNKSANTEESKMFIAKHYDKEV